MRRHVAILIVIAAAVVAVALLRPAPVRPHVTFVPHPLEKAPPPPEEPSEELTFNEPLPPEPAPPATTKLEPPRPPVPRTNSYPAREYYITVLNADGEPVEDAVVLILLHSYAMPSAASKVDSRRTDADGRTQIRLRNFDTADILAYRVGVGAGVMASVKSAVDVNLKLEPSLTLKVHCMGPFGVPLDSAEVVLTTEVVYAVETRRGQREPVVIPLPPRMLQTDREGMCAFGSVLPTGRIQINQWRSGPGIRHQLKAEWNRMKAKETVEKTPPEPFPLFLQ